MRIIPLLYRITAKNLRLQHAVCHHSWHQLGKPRHLKLRAPNTAAQTDINASTKIWAHKHTHSRWMLTDEFLFLAVYFLCWQPRHILPAHKCCRTHAHIHKGNMYTHPHTYTVTFSLLSRQRVRGHCLLSACQRKEERGEVRRRKEEEGMWMEICTEPHHSIKTNAIRGGPYLSRLMPADRVAAI